MRDTCTKCGKARDGSHQSYCRSCYNAYARQLAAASPERIAKKTRRQSLKAYGLTVAEWDAMLEAQNGGCAVCGTRVPRGRGRFHVDHDHATGAVRGLLCAHCNVAIALAGDEPVRLRALADYVERHATQAAPVTTHRQ